MASVGELVFGHHAVMALNELLGAVHAAQLQDVIARRNFDQHRDVATCRHRDAHFGDGGVENLLRVGIDLVTCPETWFFQSIFPDARSGGGSFSA